MVLNHPLWDEPGIGPCAHREILADFLIRHLFHIHALELNALRTWKENKQVALMARDHGLPAISGGDRHGFWLRAQR